MLDGEAVARPRAKVAEASEARNTRRVAHDEDRVALEPARGEPVAAIDDRDRLLAEHRGRGGDDLVVDGEDALEVVLGRVVHGRGGPAAGRRRGLAIDGCAHA